MHEKVERSRKYNWGYLLIISEIPVLIDIGQARGICEDLKTAAGI
jgi:hypothetical protein